MTVTTTDPVLPAPGEPDKRLAREDPDYLEDVVSPHLVWSYLLHHGHVRAAEALRRAWGGGRPAAGPTTAEDARGVQTAAVRRELMDLVAAGQLEAASALFAATFPGLAGGEGGAPSAAFFRLLCQHFVELVRLGRPDDALCFAEARLAPLANKHPALAGQLQGIIVLLAYANPAESPVSPLLAPEHRELVSRALNAEVMGAPESPLERILRQTVTVSEVLASFDPDNIAAGAEGAAKRRPVDLSAFLLP